MRSPVYCTFHNSQVSPAHICGMFIFRPRFEDKISDSRNLLSVSVENMCVLAHYRPKKYSFVIESSWLLWTGDTE